MNSKISQNTVRFFQPESVGERDWGEELLVALSPGKYSGKLLRIRKGHRGGLQRHQLKDETAYVYSGLLLFRFDAGNGVLQSRILGPGESVHIPPGAVHQEEALEDTVIFETGTPVFNDRLRAEREYGLEEEGGLPSTTWDEIETR